MERIPETWHLCALQVATSTGGMPTATVELQEAATKNRRRDAATGDGPVDAVFRSLERITRVTLKLTDYQIRSVTAGKEAQGEVRIEATCGGKTFSGRGASTDILEASARAYLSVINRVLSLRKPGRARRVRARGM
jgi:2-isopropylmalate synthase